MVLLLTSGIASTVSLLTFVTFVTASAALLLTFVLTCADVLGLHWGQAALERQDLSCTYLAHHELESV